MLASFWESTPCRASVNRKKVSIPSDSDGQDTQLSNYSWPTHVALTAGETWERDGHGGGVG